MSNKKIGVGFVKNKIMNDLLDSQHIGRAAKIYLLKIFYNLKDPYDWVLIEYDKGKESIQRQHILGAIKAGKIEKDHKTILNEKEINIPNKIFIRFIEPKFAD